MKNRHKRILDFVTQYIMVHGYPPSRKEIGAGVGLSSSASVQCNVINMIKLGILETDDTAEGCSRTLRVPGYKFTREEVDHEK